MGCEVVVAGTNGRLPFDCCSSRNRALAYTQTDRTDLMRGREHQAVSHRILSLAAASTCSVYDCEFVALAEDLCVPSVTVDRKML